jgi:nucleotide-binding universal stress UspA family protein
MRVLLGVDLRIHGHEWLIDQAARFCEMVDGKLDFLFVAPARSTDVDVENYRTRLANMLERVDESRRGRPIIKLGSAADMLRKSTADCDALVVGPRDPGALERMFLGSMATRVIHTSKCPVFIPRTELDPVQRVLVGIDPHNGFGERLISRAGEWAGRLGGRLDAAYIEPGHLPYIPDAKVRAQAEKDLMAGRGADRKAVNDLLGTLPESVRGGAIVRLGDPGEELVGLSERYQCLVVGTMERRGLARALLGSVAAHIVRNARCPVLTLPAVPAGQ